MASSEISHVSDTAFWVAHHRFAEGQRPDALFKDPLSGKLAGERGRQIAEDMPASRITGWIMAVRTHVIDDFLRAAIDDGVDVVLNLGAGLDTRPYRMGLPASLTWIEADYAHMIDYKEKALAAEKPRCRIERFRIDLAQPEERRAFLESVNARARKLLILTEGVVPYLDEAQTANLARDLRKLDHAYGWLLDYFSAEAMRFRRRQGMGRKMQNAPFKFNPPDWFGFFGNLGWRKKDVRYLPEEGQRLGRPFPLPWPMRMALAVVSRIAPEKRRKELGRFAGYVMLEPAPRH
jgi:methyltransferase (TIGR00027 family)